MKEPEDSVRLENVKKAKGNVIELTPHSVRYWNKVVVIGDELEPPDWSEFDGMDSWYALELRNDQAEIPKGAFENNVDLTMITAPSVTSIGEVAFQGCAALESASFPKVRSIGAFAFNECERLRRVSFDLVEQIDDRAFQDCASILDISLPNTLSRLDGNPFIGCSSLESIRVDAENPCYESRGDILYSKGGGLLIACPAGKKADSIKSRAVEIGCSAFAGCRHIEEVCLPETRVIGHDAFCGCVRLRTVRIPKIELACGATPAFMDGTGFWAWGCAPHVRVIVTEDGGE